MPDREVKKCRDAGMEARVSGHVTGIEKVVCFPVALSTLPPAKGEKESRGGRD